MQRYKKLETRYKETLTVSDYALKTLCRHRSSSGHTDVTQHLETLFSLDREDNFLLWRGKGIP